MMWLSGFILGVATGVGVTVRIIRAERSVQPWRDGESIDSDGWGLGV